MPHWRFARPPGMFSPHRERQMDTSENNRAFARSFFGNNDDGSLHPDDAD